MGESGGREGDGASGSPVALQEQLQTLTGIVQVTISDHQGIGTLRMRRERVRNTKGLLLILLCVRSVGSRAFCFDRLFFLYRGKLKVEKV